MRVRGLSDHRLSFREPGIRETNGLSPHTMTSGFTFQIFAYASALVIPGLVNFLALALYTRYLSSEAYGRYAFVVAVVITVKMVTFDWLRLGLFRFFQSAQRDGRLPVLISTTMTGFAIISLLVVIAWLVLLAPWSFEDEKIRSGMWLGLPLIVMWALFELILEINRAAIAPMRYGMLSVCRAILCLGAALWFIRVIGLNETGLMLGLVLGTAVPAMVGLSRWRSNLTHKSVEREVAIDLLRYSMPFAIIVSLDLFPSISSRLLLQHFLGSGAVGLFTASYDLGNHTVTMLFVSLNMAAYPLVVRSLEHKGEDVARAQLRKYSILLFAAALPGGVFMTLMAQPISTLVLGEVFRNAAAQLIPWVALSALVMGVKAFYFDLAFQLGLRTKLQIWAAAAAALTSVVLGLWWIPTYGLMGAIWATCAAHTSALIISIGLGRKIFPLPFPVWDLFRIGLAVIVMAVVSLLLHRDSHGWIQLARAIGLGGVVYIVTIWLLNVDHIRQRCPAVTLGWIKNTVGTNSGGTK